jgi:hypothetical protein
MPAILVAAFLAAHTLIHLGFTSPRPAPAPGGPEWPFELARSWMLGPLGLDPALSRAAGIALLAVLALGYSAAALAVLGALPATAFGPGVVVGSVASLALLAVFFHPWLVLGVAIDLVLLWAVLVARWTPAGLGT